MMIAPPYRRSSFCGGGACVEVAPLPDGTVVIRDSKDLTVPEHHYTPEEWSDFIQGVKAGEFDFDLPGGSPRG
jgi:hypothetical protein